MIFSVFWSLEKATLGQKGSTLIKSAPMRVLSRQVGHAVFVFECGSNILQAAHLAGPR